MRRGKASNTSSFVTLMRALADAGITEVPDFSDPTAMELLPARWRLPGRALLWCMQHRPEMRRTLLSALHGSWDGITLRTMALDQAWSEAHANGTRQLVLLGAGLDGRAFRLPNVGDCTVFEVDHPATQTLKAQRARALVCRAQRHVFVPVEFETGGLASALAAAGHRADALTCWIWEGVLPYLTYEAQHATLAIIAERSAPGSCLAMTYVQPDSSYAMVGARILVNMVGEPFIGLLTPAAAAASLRNVGLQIIEDSGPEAWYARFARGAAAAPSPTMVRERLVVARKQFHAPSGGKGPSAMQTPAPSHQA